MDLGMNNSGGGMKLWSGSGNTDRRDDSALCLLSGLPTGLPVSMSSQSSGEDAVFQGLSCGSGVSHANSLLCDLDNPVSVTRSDAMVSGTTSGPNVTVPQYKCPLCHRQFAKESSLKNHVRSHNKVLLPQHQLVQPVGNQQILLQQSQLNLLQQQSQQRQQQALQMNLGQTTCKSCFKSFNSVLELKEHRKHEHGDMSDDNNVMCIGSNGNSAAGLLGGSSQFVTPGLIGGCNIPGTNGTVALGTPQPHYQCSECGKSMKSAARLYAHFSAAHTAEASQFSGTGGGAQNGGDPGGQYSCHVCGLGLSRPDRLKSHVMTHTGEKPYACTVCSHRFRRSDKLMIHMRIHTGERNYACPDCDMRFMRSDHLKNHRRIHSGERPYRCTQCDACFMRSDKLTHHMKVHTDSTTDTTVDFLAACATDTINKFMDAGSGADVNTSGAGAGANCEWEGQIKTSNTLTLDDLRGNNDMHHVVSQGLMSSIKQDDDDEVDDDDDEDNDKKGGAADGGGNFCSQFTECMNPLCQHSSQCKSERKDKTCKQNETSTCSHNVQQMGQLQQQVQLINPQQLYSFKPYIDPRPSVIPHPPAHPPPTIYPCMQTGMIGNYRFSANLLKQLTNAVAAHAAAKSQEKPYRCTQCDARFARASGLSMHALTHSGQKTHQCTICQRSFFHESKLKSHMSCHHPGGANGSLRCEYCQKEFTRIDRLRNHTRTHTGERKFACTMCTKAFTRSDHLKIHLRIHTGEKPYRCTDCDKSYARSDKLKKHLKTHNVDIGGGGSCGASTSGASVVCETSSCGLITTGGMT